MNPSKVLKVIEQGLKPSKVTNAAIFNVIRTLKGANKGDSYYENYMWHYEKRGDKFIDYYHILWHIGAKLPVKRILEIGCRTGISIAQLLSSMIKYDGVKIVLCDLFNDGFIYPSLVKMNLKYINTPVSVIDNILFLIGDSLVEIPKYKADNPNEKFDYILVDGNHDRDYAAKDLSNVVDMLDEGGILFFDDIAPDGCGLIDVWNSFKVKHFEEFYFLENCEDGKGIGIGVRKNG